MIYLIMLDSLISYRISSFKMSRIWFISKHPNFLFSISFSNSDGIKKERLNWYNLTLLSSLVIKQLIIYPSRNINGNQNPNLFWYLKNYFTLHGCAGFQSVTDHHSLNDETQHHNSIRTNSSTRNFSTKFTSYWLVLVNSSNYLSL